MKTPIHSYKRIQFILCFLCFNVSLFVFGTLNAQTITTVAGNGIRGYLGDGGVATKAELGGSNGLYVAADLGGNIYIADPDNQRIRKVDFNGNITTIAGNGTLGFSGDGSLAINAKLYNPTGIAVDASGNVFFADRGNNRIRKVGANGIISTVAGNGTSGYSGDGGLAINAKLNNPVAIGLDPTGNIYIADSRNNRVRKVDGNGTITTMAGNGTAGFSGDGGPAINAMLNGSLDMYVCADQNGALYISDTYNNRIRKVTTNGTISTFAGNGVAGFSGDGGLATSAKINVPHGLTVDQSGNLYISDFSNSRIRKVAPNGTISSVAGNGKLGFSGDGGPATSATLYSPSDAKVDAAGNLYIGDPGNNRVRKVTFNQGKVSQTITFNPLPTVIYGALPITLAATSSSGLAITYSSSNTSVAMVSGNTITILAVGTSIITAAQAGNALFNPAINVPQTLTVGQSPQTITFGVLPTVSYGAAPFTLNASASSGLQVSYSSGNTSVATVSGNTLTIVGAGTASITASQPGNNNYAAASNVIQILLVAQANQSITFNPLPPVSFGASPITLMATASSGLQVSYSSDNPAVATLSGNILTVVGVGAANITAGQSGNANYAAAFNVSQQLIVGQAGQSITFNPIPQVTFGAPPFTLTATASSGLPVSYSSDNQAVASINGNVLTIIGAGTANITASQPGNTNFAASGNVAQQLTVGQAAQSIVFNALPTVALGTPPISLAATASSGLPVSYSSSNTNVASVSGNTLTIVNAGSATITAVQPGNANYSAAANVAQGLIVTQPIISTISGNGSAGFSGDGGQSASSTLNLPIDVAVDGDGNLYIADYYNNRVRKVATTGIMTTVAGNGIAGMSGDGGPAVNAQLNNPTGVVVDPSGNLFISDQKNNRIRKVDTRGIISTYVGASISGTSGLPALKPTNYPLPVPAMRAPTGQVGQTIYFALLPSVNIGAAPIYLTASATSGLRVSFSSSNPSVANVNGNTLTIIGAGVTTITAMQSGDGTYAPAPNVPQQFTVTPLILNNPMGIALDGAGNLYIADASNNAVRKVDTNGNITTIASNLNEPRDVAVDGNGNVFIADFRNHRIQKVTNGTMTTVAGNGAAGFSGDGGPAVNAMLNYPHGIAVDRNGNLFVADYYNNRIRRVDGNGIIGTVVGNGVQGFSGDGGPASSAQIAGPRNLSIDGAGTIYFADGINQRVRKVGQSTVPTTARLSKIEFPALPTKTLGDNPFHLSASSGSGIPIRFTSDNQNVAEVNGNILTIVGIGTANITASHEGNGTFNGVQTSQLLVVNEKPLSEENILYPNPSKDFIYLTAIDGDFAASITDISTGHTSAINLTLKDGLLVGDIRNFASGAYVIRIISNGRVVQNKFIKP